MIEDVNPVRAQDRTSTIDVSTALIKTNGYGIKDPKTLSYREWKANILIIRIFLFYNKNVKNIFIM